VRHTVLERLKCLLRERAVDGWRDGWVYGRLKQEFELQPDELNAIADVLGFKYGWNAALEQLLWKQWQEEEGRWQERELATAKMQIAKRQRAASIAQDLNIAKVVADLQDELVSHREVTTLEKKLIKIILSMNT
jgi:hypothetical protein